MICNNCGKEIPDGSRFCVECGAAVPEQPAAGAGSTSGSYDAGSAGSTSGSYDAGSAGSTSGSYDAGTVGSTGNTSGSYNAGGASGSYDAGSQGSYQQNQYQQNQYQQAPSSGSGGIDVFGAAILCYFFGIIGWLVAYLASDRENPFLKFHLNQALVLFLATFLSAIPIVGAIWGVFVFVCWIISLVGAIQKEEKEAPLIGKIHIIN